jgi:hypothetical protein
VSQTRFQPARAGGAPVAVNVVWMLAHTTVFGKEDAEVVRLAPAWRPVRETHAPPPAPPSVPVSRTEPGAVVQMASV